MSRDKGDSAGARGSDGISARSFAANLDRNLKSLAKEISAGSFNFSVLRPCVIDRPGKTDRIICVPTVRDRLVQRRMAFYIHQKRLLPIINEVSFGFIPETGTKHAIRRCIELREEHDYVFETDIVSFFDRIDRSLLAKKANKYLSKCSLLPLVEQAIKLEVKPTDDCSLEILAAAGIQKGRGLRQGMPLSPILANLALSDFDTKAVHLGIKMVRYADDIVVFAKSKTAASQVESFVRDELKEIDHTIPDLYEGSKTQLRGKGDPFEFLGREIYFSKKDGRYVQRISKRKMESIFFRIDTAASLSNAISKNENLTTLLQRLRQLGASYSLAYSDVNNATHFDNELKRRVRLSIKKIFYEIFGKGSVDKLSLAQEAFIGIAKLDFDFDETFEF